MNTRTAQFGEFSRAPVAAGWKVLACATLSLAITLATMLTIGDTAGTRLFVSQSAAAPTLVASAGTAGSVAR